MFRSESAGNAIKILGLTAEAAAVQVLKSSYQELIETMADLGPAGAVVAGFAQGSLTVMTAMENQMASHTAIENAYSTISKIDFVGKYYRKDIGRKGLNYIKELNL